MKIDIYKKAIIIREFESLLLELFSQGKLNGTVHTCVGQELIPVIISEYIQSDDVFFSNHRGHGHYIVKTNNVKELLAEIMGYSSGCSRGFGGSQHLFSHKSFYSNGIQGGMTPIAAGYSYSLDKRNSTEPIAIVFIGDGTLGEGILYEASNLASIYKCPLLIVIENNGYAQSTSIKQTFSGDIQKRFEGFGFKYNKANIWELEEFSNTANEIIKYVRNNRLPAILEIDCYRLNSHSKGDDNRNLEEITFYREKDPINLFEKSNPDISAEIKGQIKRELESYVSEIQNEQLLNVILETQKIKNNERLFELAKDVSREARVNEQIYAAFKDYFKEDPDIMMFGEDIEAITKYTNKEYGGAFKVTKDLSIIFPGRINNTPISEAGITGFAIGAALEGRKMIIEIMFGDFTTLILDQLLQHASKFTNMYGIEIRLPLLIRTPMGGKRGYGPTHSQSLEKIFLGIKGLTVIALNFRVNVYDIYTKLLQQLESPTLVIENKVDYTRKLVSSIKTHEYYLTKEDFPTLKVTPKKIPSQLTVFCYGGSLEEVELAAEFLYLEYEIAVEIICPILIYPINIYPIMHSIDKTKKLITVEEGSSFSGLGSEIVAQLKTLGKEFELLGQLSNEDVIPSSYSAELNLLPNKEKVINLILKKVYEI